MGHAAVRAQSSSPELEEIRSQDRASSPKRQADPEAGRKQQAASFKPQAPQYDHIYIGE